MKEAMNILCGLDESYTQHCAVMLSSLFRSTPQVTIRVFLLTQDLSEESLKHIRRVCERYRHEMVPLYTDRQDLSDAPVMAHISKATYLRLLVEHLLPADLERVLYLDADLIVRSDLRPFYTQDLQGFFVAAVAEAPLDGRNKKLGMKDDEIYFNAGVLLMNLPLWRERQIGEAALKFAIDNADWIEWGDQDALNATLDGRVKICPPKWNAGEWVFLGLSADQLGVAPSDLEDAQTDPAIVHYNGGHKPWGAGGIHRPFARDYYYHLKRTPYFGRKHLIKRVRSKGRQILRKFGFA